MKKIETTKQEPKKPKTRQQLGVFIDSAIWRAFRAHAIANGLTATELLEAIMTRELERVYGKQQGAKKRLI
jgi:hypothetical protein